MLSVGRRLIAFRAALLLSRAASLPSNALVARFEKHGDPQTVLSLKEEPLKPAGQGEVVVKFLFSPINPADLNKVQGNYPESDVLPAIGGGEGVAQVVQAGAGAVLKEGDLVLPSRPGIGTWRTFATLREDDVVAVPKVDGIKPEYLATLSVNPASALRMLEDFVDLKSGDVVIQNGANSMVGLSVIQIAAARGIKTLNVIRRSRSDYDILVERMKQYGGHIVVGDDYLRTPEFRALIADLPKPKLALNCVGGDSATEIARLLAPHGTLVTYGGMSHKPVTVPTGALIFNDLHLRGFWLTSWYAQHGHEGRLRLLQQLLELVQKQKLRLWTETHSFQKGFPAALQRAIVTHTRDRKVLLAFD